MLFYSFFLGFIAILCGRYNIIPNHYLIPKKIGYNLAIFFIIFVTSFRFNIGYDWSSYFGYVYPKFEPRNILRLEPLSKIIVSIAGITGHPILMFAIYAVITYVNIGSLINKYSMSKYESLMIYICLFYLPDLSTIRQALAVSFTFYGFTYIKQRKFFKYFLICVLATMFHKTAIVALLFYPLYYVGFLMSTFFVMCVYIGVKILLPVFLGNFLPVFLMYIEKGGIQNSSGNFQRLIYMSLFAYTLIFHRKRTQGLLNICLVGTCLPFILGGHTGGRLAQYFLIYFCLLIPECNKRFDINYRIVFMFVFYAYFFMYLFVTVVANNSNEYVPFRWYFIESLDQELM